MSMQSLMGADLAQLFARDMPAECQIGAQIFLVLADDLLSGEIENYGGPEDVEMQRVHFLTSEKPSIENGSKLALRQKSADGKSPGPWRSKIVISSIASEDGNELIATVRGD